MRTVDIREVLIREQQKPTAAHVSAIIGRTLGDVGVEELMQAASVAKDDQTGLELPGGFQIREVQQESEEE